MTGRSPRRRRVSAVCLLAVLACLPLEAAARLEATVEPGAIDELDTARLTIRVTGSGQIERLDLEPLDKDFEVLTSRSSSEYQSINGRTTSSIEYQILLRPRRTGKLTIPSLDVGGESTRPLTLEVRGMDPALKDTIDRMVFFRTELTRNPVYVQAETVLVRRLYYSSGAQIYSDLPGTPEIPNAVVVPLGEPQSSTAERNGQRYGMIEQRFGIFPERSGDLTIPAISVTSSVRVQSGGRTRRSGVQVGTQPMTLEVLPVPAEYPRDAPWLPARNVTVTDEWKPADDRLKVGEPLSRTVTARVQGNVSSAIPPLTPGLPATGFKSYPEPPDLKDDTGGGTVRGERRQAYSIIPTAPGNVTLPATEVVWWDVDAHRVRTARAPARTLTITGTAATSHGQGAGQPAPTTGSAAAPPPAQAPPPPASLQTAPSTAQASAAAAAASAPRRLSRRWWYLLAIVAAIAMAATTITMLHRFPAGHPRPPSRRACWRGLKRACRRGDAAAVHGALLDCLRAHYGSPAAEALQRFRKAGHGDVVDAVNASLYRPGDPSRIDGARVLAAVGDLRRRRRVPSAPLPALYD